MYLRHALQVQYELESMNRKTESPTNPKKVATAPGCILRRIAHRGQETPVDAKKDASEETLEWTGAPIGFRVFSLGFRVQGSGSRGVGFRV